MKIGVLVGGLVAAFALLAPASAQEPPPEPALKPFQPFRVAQFSRYLADGTEVLDEPIIRDGGRLNFHQRFPDSHFDRPPNDGLNLGRIFSSPSGVTYGVEVQSPASGLVGVSGREIGNKADLQWRQTFRKDSADATLRYTRTGLGASAGKVAAQATLALTVRGLPADASGVIVNLTATEPDGDGFVTVWPCGQPRPLASNLNFVAGQLAVPNLAAVALGPGQQICLSGNTTTHLIADLSGSYHP